MPNEQYRIFMESYVRFMEEMAEGESKKYAAMLSYDPKRIDHAVSRQQAMNMRLGQMEEQRELEQKRAGLEGLTFQQILARLEPEEREVFTALWQSCDRVPLWKLCRRSRRDEAHGLRRCKADTLA